MVIKQKQQEHKGSFYIEEEGSQPAELTYTMSGTSLMIIDHTEVSDALRGRNAGYRLVQAAVEFARANHIRIFPFCTFAKSVFDKKGAEFGDVLHVR